MARLRGQTVAGHWRRLPAELAGLGLGEPEPLPSHGNVPPTLEGKNNNNHNLNKRTETEQGSAKATPRLPEGLSSPGVMGCAGPYGWEQDFPASSQVLLPFLSKRPPLVPLWEAQLVYPLFSHSVPWQPRGLLRAAAISDGRSPVTPALRRAGRERLPLSGAGDAPVLTAPLLAPHQQPEGFVLCRERGRAAEERAPKPYYILKCNNSTMSIFVDRTFLEEAHKSQTEGK